jgi:hypothetical protein
LGWCWSARPARARRVVAGAAALALVWTLAVSHAARAATDNSGQALGVSSQTDPGGPEFEAMREGGVGTYRWLISWPAVQPEEGRPPDWTGTDRVVANLAEHDIDPLALVYGSPCFAVDCSSTARSQAVRQPPLGSPEAKLAWGGFLAALVERYGPKGTFWSENPSLPYRPVRAWQIWNEPNTPHFYAPAPSVEGYAELLRISAGAIRPRDAHAEVLTGGMVGDPRGRGALDAAEYLDALYRIPGAKRHFDTVAVHPYAQQIATVRRLTRDAHRVVASHDPDTSISVTELGWGASPGGRGWLMETPAGQAANLEGAFRSLLEKRDAWNVARIVWFSWRDPPGGEGDCQWCRTSGLFDEAGRARPAWTAYMELSAGTGALPDGRGAPALPDQDDEGSAGIVPLIAAAALVIAGAAGIWLARRRSRAGSQ